MVNNYSVTNLVSNNPNNNPQLLDPYVSLGWGIAIRPAGFGGHFWINNSATGTVTEYIGDVGGIPLSQDALKVVEVTPAPGNPFGLSGPSGQVFNGSGDFVITQDHPNGEITAPSKFIFVATDGSISGWTERRNEDGSFDRPLESEVVVNKLFDSIYYGVAITNFETDNLLYAADFGFTPDIEVYDAEFNEITEQFEFLNPFAAEGYAEYNIQLIDNSLFVAYAQPDPLAPGNEVIEPGLGRIAEFDLDGNLISIWDDGDLLNAPWGFVLAPDDFGDFSNALLVSNFGDGTIVAFDRETREPIDYLRDDSGEPIAIDGLWGLTFGNGASLGESNDLYFAAGNDLGDNAGDGVFGKVEVTADLDPVPEGGDQTVTGTPEDDLFTIGGDNNVISTDAGNDVITARGDNQTIEAGAGDNIIAIGSGEVTTGDGNNFIVANSGSATVNTGAGDDSVNLVQGNLEVDAGEGDNHIVSGDGNDVILAGSGDDTVHAGAGNNIINVGEGDNLINSVLTLGGLPLSVGNNTITTGAGADTFQIAPGAGVATITNFDSSDRFDLWGFKLDFSGAIAFSDLTIIQEGSDTVIQLTGTDDVLAVLQNTDAETVDESYFTGEVTTELPVVNEIESNDTIATATNVSLSTDAPEAIATGSINFDFDNNRDVDATEDVDLYAFELAAGDTIILDLDPSGDVKPIDAAELILFDSEGNNIAQGSFTNPGPEDAFTSLLPYIEYTVAEAGTYYAGVSAYLNADTFFASNAYDPFTAGSSSGVTFEQFGLNSFGDYALNFELVNDSTPVVEMSEPPITGTPAADAPTISLQTITGTYNADGSIIAPVLVETVSDLGLSPIFGIGGAALTFELTTEGAIPVEGVEVVINSDVNLADYLFTVDPFVRGAETLGPVLNADGNPSGIRLNVTEDTALFNINLFDKPVPETDGPEQITFTLESGDANISDVTGVSTITVYDTVADVPTTSTEGLTVGLAVENGALIEADGNRATLTFNLSEPPPEGGVLAYVNLSAKTAGQTFEGQTFGLLGQFDVFNAEITGGAFPVPDFASSGFYFNITEQTATISVAAFQDEVVEGIQGFEVSLAGSADYQVDPAASAVSVTLADTAESLPQISLSTEPTVLVESEQTASVHTFTLSAPPSPEGLQVSVTVEGLEEFDLSSIETTGITGDISIAESFPPQLIFTVNEDIATITLPIADDGETEELETATFTLNPRDTYQIDEIAASGSFQIVDTPDQVPASPLEIEVNDSLDTAIAINPTTESPVIISGAANYIYDFSGTIPILDFSEDVDLYSFELSAGESIEVNVDATVEFDGSDSLLKPVLRLFDADGNELDTVGQVDSLDEISSEPGEATLTFTTETDGIYYAGISVLGNDDYDPTLPGSGSGWIIEGIAEPGAYEVSFEFI
ncbi:MAG: TIGR03118 family protein [Cyanobacteria bacterium P01_F01_bin.143]